MGVVWVFSIIMLLTGMLTSVGIVSLIVSRLPKFLRKDV